MKPNTITNRTVYKFDDRTVSVCHLSHWSHVMCAFKREVGVWAKNAAVSCFKCSISTQYVSLVSCVVWLGILNRELQAYYTSY
jgi:hypothetical protein